MRTLLRLLSVLLASCIVGCEKRPIIGEIIAVVRPAGIETPVFTEPDGASTLAIIRSEKFWQERVVPRLKNQSLAIRSFLDSREVHFVAIYTGKYTVDKASRYLGIFELRFRNLTRADAAIVFHAIVAAYEDETEAELRLILPDVIRSLGEAIRVRKKWLEALPQNSPEAEKLRKHITALEKKITEIPDEKPSLRIISSRILE